MNRNKILALTFGFTFATAASAEPNSSVYFACMENCNIDYVSCRNAQEWFCNATYSVCTTGCNISEALSKL